MWAVLLWFLFIHLVLLVLILPGFIYSAMFYSYTVSVTRFPFFSIPHVPMFSGCFVYSVFLFRVFLCSCLSFSYFVLYFLFTGSTLSSLLSVLSCSYFPGNFIYLSLPSLVILSFVYLFLFLFYSLTLFFYFYLL